MTNGALTGKQQRFLDEFVKDRDWNAAAKRAGYKAPHQSVLALRRSGVIREAIEQLRADVETDGIMTAQQVLTACSDVIRSSTAKDGVRVSAMRLMFERHGLRVKRHEHGGLGEFSHLTDAQVEAEIESLLDRRNGARNTAHDQL